MSIVKVVCEVRKNLPRLVGPDGRARIGIVEKLVRDSSWWLAHPRGPVHAPKHYERIQDGRHGYEIEFGANSFLAEAAILDCAKVIDEGTGEVERTGELLSKRLVEQKLLVCVIRSVSNYRGDRVSYKIRLDGYFEFGANGVFVPTFLSGIWQCTKLDLITQIPPGEKPKGSEPFLDSLRHLFLGDTA